MSYMCNFATESPNNNDMMKRYLTHFLVAVMSIAPSVASAFSETETFPRHGNLRVASANRVTSEAQMRKSISRESLADLPLVKEAEGTQTDYSRNSVFFGRDFYGGLYMSADYGRIAEVVEGDEGKVYMKNPYNGINTGSYLVGSREGDKITFSFPQKIYEETYIDWEADPEGTVTRTDSYYAYKLDYSDDGTTSSMKMSQEQSMAFTVSADGISTEDVAYIGLLMAVEVPDEATGETQTGLVWTGFADSDIALTTVTEQPVELPSDVTMEPWVMASEQTPRFVNVGFSGNEVYMQGVLTTAPETVFKGELKDGVITFKGPQYMGRDLKNGHFAYFHPAEVLEADPDEGIPFIFSSLPEMALTYDAEARVISCPGNTGFAVSTIPQSVFLIEGYAYPEFMWQDMETPMTPDIPEILYYEYFDDMEFGAISYVIPINSVDGRLMDSSKLYYEFYLDDSLMTLYPDEYTDLKEPMTEIPYSYEDSNIYFWGDIWEAVIYPVGFEKIGVRAIYVNSNGERAYSDIIYNDGTLVGINAAAATKRIVSEEYYSLDGIRLQKPLGNTISVKKTIFEDGSVKTSKIFVK